MPLAVAGCGGGGDTLSGGDLPSAAPTTMAVRSQAFADGGRIPQRYTCDGAGDEPEVTVTRVPANARELVLVVSDPDAPGGRFVHLTRFGLRPPDLRGGSEGENSAGSGGWTPPCPPKGDEPHRYEWTVYALRSASELKEGARPEDVTAALRDGVEGRGTLTGRYGR